MHHVTLYGQYPLTGGHREGRQRAAACAFVGLVACPHHIHMLRATGLLSAHAFGSLGSRAAQLDRCHHHHLSPLSTRSYARTPRSASQNPTSSDLLTKEKEKLKTIEKTFHKNLSNVRATPKAPELTDEDRNSPVEVQKRLSSIARSTAQKTIKNEVKKISLAANDALELPPLPTRKKSAKLSSIKLHGIPTKSSAGTTPSAPLPPDVPVPPEELKKFLEELNAQDVVILDLREKCNWARYFLVASSPSTKQLQGISEALIARISRTYPRVKPVADAHDEWIAVDLNTIVIHLMLPRTRRYYKIEEIWASMLPLSKQTKLDMDEAYQESMMLPDNYEEEPEPEFRIVERKYENEVDEDDEEESQANASKASNKKTETSRQRLKAVAKKAAAPAPANAKLKNVKTTVVVASSASSGSKGTKPKQEKQAPDDALIEELFGPVDNPIVYPPPTEIVEKPQKKSDEAPKKPLTSKQIKHANSESGPSENHTTTKRATKARHPKSPTRKEDEAKEMEELIKNHEVIPPKRTVHKKSHRLPEALKRNIV